MLEELKRFEHFVSYITVRRDFSAAFDTTDIVVGEGNDTGIEGSIACIVNGSLITDVGSLIDFANNTEILEVTFIFVQGDPRLVVRGREDWHFCLWCSGFFQSAPTLPRNEAVSEAAKIMSAVYERSGKFKRGNPTCRLLTPTTGKVAGRSDS